jgi:hypothetical protein
MHYPAATGSPLNTTGAWGPWDAHGGLPQLSTDQDSSGEHADQDSSGEHADLVGTASSTPHRRDPRPPAGYHPPVASSEFPAQIPV